MRYYRGEFLFLAVSDSSDPDWTGHEVIMGYAAYSTTVKTVEKPCPRGWLGNLFERKALDWYLAYANVFGLDRSIDPVALEHFRSVLNAPNFAKYFESLPQRHKEVKQDQHWELGLLGTHPDYRRRGVGKMMLQWGFDRATSDGVPLVLIGTTSGEKLYLQCGFREVARVDLTSLVAKGRGKARLEELDMGLGRGKGLNWAAMVWEPPNVRSDEHNTIQV